MRCMILSVVTVNILRVLSSVQGSGTASYSRKSGEVAPGFATIITQLSNVILRAIEQDHKIRELDDFEEHLAALEGGRDGDSRAAA